MKTFLCAVFALLLTATVTFGQAAIQPKTLSGTQCPGDGCMLLPLNGYGVIGIQVTGTFSGTLAFEGTIDGTTWTTLEVLPNGSDVAVTSTTSVGSWSVKFPAIGAARIRFSAYVSGSALVSVATNVAVVSTSGGTGTPAEWTWDATTLTAPIDIPFRSRNAADDADVPVIGFQTAPVEGLYGNGIVIGNPATGVSAAGGTVVLPPNVLLGPGGDGIVGVSHDVDTYAQILSFPESNDLNIAVLFPDPTAVSYSVGPNSYPTHTGVALLGRGLAETGDNQTWYGDATNDVFIQSHTSVISWDGSHFALPDGGVVRAAEFGGTVGVDTTVYLESSLSVGGGFSYVQLDSSTDGGGVTIRTNHPVPDASPHNGGNLTLQADAGIDGGTAGKIVIPTLGCPSGQTSPVTVDDTGTLVAGSCS